MKAKVLIPQDITQAGKDYLKDKGYQVKVLEDASVETLKKEVADADAVLFRTAKYPREVLEAGKNVKVYARYGAGVDNLDVAAATELGIWVCNAPVANSNSVAEHTIALIMACANNLIVQDRQARQGNYNSRNEMPSNELRGKTLGLVGCGHIGQLVAQKAYLGLGMKVKGYDEYIAPEKLPDYIEKTDDLEEIFSTCDYVSLHIPATPQTRNLVDRKLLAKMKKTGVLINCARGGIVNEKDLYEALAANRIKAAGLDVFENEPDILGNPLFDLDRVIVSPHNAALTYEAMDQMGIDAAKGIDEVLSGQVPKWAVNKPVLK